MSEEPIFLAEHRAHMSGKAEDWEPEDCARAVLRELRDGIDESEGEVEQLFVVTIRRELDGRLRPRVHASHINSLEQLAVLDLLAHKALVDILRQPES
jgi:hypothetical protein